MPSAASAAATWSRVRPNSAARMRTEKSLNDERSCGADALESDTGEVAEQPAVHGRQGVAPLGFALEQGEALEAQQRAGLGQTGVEADEDGVVGARVAVLATDHDALGDLVVVGRDDPPSPVMSSLVGDVLNTWARPSRPTGAPSRRAPKPWAAS